MAGALIARRALAAAPRGVRFAHVENTAYNALPGGLLNPAKKGSVGFKIAAFMGTGFSLPFLVAKFQTWKAT